MTKPTNRRQAMTEPVFHESKTMMKCGHAANSMGSPAGSTEKMPACVICSCFEQAESPNLTGRKARCAYYGTPVKSSWYNGNACDVCKTGENCQCEKPSSTGLWFFASHPDKEYDEFYCACHGAD